MKQNDSQTTVPPDKSVDSQWVRAVVEEFETPLLRHAARLLRGDVHRARDVVQDTFLKLWQAERCSVEPHLAQWLFKVSRNRALDVIRKESRMLTLNGQPPEAETGTATIDQRPDRILSESEDKRSAIGLLDELPDRQQEAIRLKLQAQRSHKEIASVLETSVSNVGMLIHTGLKTIRGALGVTGDSSSDNSGGSEMTLKPQLPASGGGEVLT